jgi:hypothetical protein
VRAECRLGDAAHGICGALIETSLIEEKRLRAPAGTYDVRMNADSLRHGNTLTPGTTGRLPPHQLRSADFPAFFTCPTTLNLAALSQNFQ